jgi:hypothetical protein
MAQLVPEERRIGNTIITTEPAEITEKKRKTLKKALIMKISPEVMPGLIDSGC